MKRLNDIVPDRADRLPLLILVLFLIVLGIAGGGSRADIVGQAIVRGASVVAIVSVVLIGRDNRILEYRAVALTIAGGALLVSAQLIPLPPSVWAALPGRSNFATVQSLAGLPQPWRPLNISPDGGVNSLFSLLPPTAMLLIIASLTVRAGDWLLMLVLGWVIAGSVFALAQTVGVLPEVPFINAAGDNSGFFANRNHQALFLAIGIILAIFWGFKRGIYFQNRRLWLSMAITVLLLISILVAGSRSGMLLGAFAVLAGVSLAQSRTSERDGKKRVAIVIIAAIALIGLVAYLSLYAGRALSIDRVAAATIGDEFRVRALPTLWRMVQDYFPVGAGFGTFDPAFRIAEPLSLLEPTYLNHAHNDFIEVLIEGGLPAFLLLAGAAIAFCRAAIAIFFASTGEPAKMREGRLGALIIVMITAASVSDYPARTPIIMSVLVIAGCWMCNATASVRFGSAR